MKPEGPVLRRSEWFVDSIPLGMAGELIAAFHYAKASANTAVFRHGLFHVDNPIACLGAALWMPPTKPAAVSVDDEWRRVLALSRLVVMPDVPTNAASFLMARSINLIRRDGRYRTLVTYADEGQGHTGAIYRATNWDDVGYGPTSHPGWIDGDGRRVAVKAKVNRTYAEMEALGYTRTPATRKRKFVMRLA